MQNDLIFRDDVLEYAEILRVPMEHESYNDCRAVSVNDILAVPAVDAEVVRHGRWYYGECSVCKGICIHYKPPYCPNCGARMDGGADGD